MAAIPCPSAHHDSQLDYKPSHSCAAAAPSAIHHIKLSPHPHTYTQVHPFTKAHIPVSSDAVLLCCIRGAVTLEKLNSLMSGPVMRDVDSVAMPKTLSIKLNREHNNRATIKAYAPLHLIAAGTRQCKAELLLQWPHLQAARHQPAGHHATLHFQEPSPPPCYCAAQPTDNAHLRCRPQLTTPRFVGHASAAHLHNRFLCQATADTATTHTRSNCYSALQLITPTCHHCVL